MSAEDVGERHLDDEQLSDLLDGEGAEEDRAHLAGCDRCTARLAAWRDAMRSVSGMPLPTAQLREAAVNAALASVDRGDRRLGFPARIAAAAAAIALIAGVSAAVLAGGGGRANHPTASRPTSAPVQSGSGVAGGASSSSGSAGGAVNDLRNLGNIDNPIQLANALRPAFGSQSAIAGASAGTPAARSAQPCATPALTGGTFNDSAGLVWKGTPAVVFVFTTSRGHTAVVESGTGCKTLATVTF